MSNTSNDLPILVGVVGGDPERSTDVAVDLARRVLPVAIAREEARKEQETQAADKAAGIAQLVLRDGQKRSLAVDEAHAKYVANRSPENLDALSKVIHHYAYAPTMILSNAREYQPIADVAAKHCVDQVQKYKPLEHNGKTVRFSTWAAKVIRNKVRDANRRLWREERRQRRIEVKHIKQDSEKILRKRQESRERYRVEFSSTEIEAVAKKLRPIQLQLLTLKSKTPKLPDAKIAAKLGVTLPQLRNRWTRLRRKVKRMLESMARLELLLNARQPQQNWYPGAPNTPYVAFTRSGWHIPRSARRGPRGVFNF
jgi:RNA polymerase sigma factor (sigma-70 family)